MRFIVVLFLMLAAAGVQAQENLCMTDKSKVSQCWDLANGRQKCAVMPGKHVVTIEGKRRLVSCEPAAATLPEAWCGTVLPSVWSEPGRPPCLADKPLLPASPVGTVVLLEDNTRPYVGDVKYRCQLTDTGAQWVEVTGSRSCRKE